jgi:putative component of membrane protein insertase Oxa1/YidC/SpoIIIJ protein YidD
MRRALLAAIGAYQRYVSPYKGFCCAYRQHTGRSSCSTLGYRAVRRYGAFAGLGVIRKRTQLCGIAHRRHHEDPRTNLHPERGVCDVGCDVPCDFSCDAPGPSTLGRICDFTSCCDCGSCDWPKRRKHSRDQEKYVYIPPRVRSRVEPGKPRPEGEA